MVLTAAFVDRCMGLSAKKKKAIRKVKSRAHHRAVCARVFNPRIFKIFLGISPFCSSHTERYLIFNRRNVFVRVFGTFVWTGEHCFHRIVSLEFRGAQQHAMDWELV